MSKVIKQMEMNDIRRTFDGVRDMVVLTTNKLSAQGEYVFRASLRKKGVRVRQVKNTLARRVFREMNLAIPDDSPFWAKQTMLAWGGDSIAGLSKEVDAELKNPKNATLYRSKQEERITVKGAIADGSPVTFDQAKAMPTRADLLAQIVGMILSPGAQVAGCLEGPAKSLAACVKSVEEKLEKSEGEAAAATPAAV